MILKIEYINSKVVKQTIIDNVEKIDTGFFDDGVEFINVYKNDRKHEDDFTTIRVEGVNVYTMNSSGKTLTIHRSK